MGSLVSFRRKLDSLVLEEVKQQAKQSWYSSQTMPTEVVDALVAEVERLRELFAAARRWHLCRETFQRMRLDLHAGVRYQALGTPLREAKVAEVAFWSTLAELEMGLTKGKKNG